MLQYVKNFIKNYLAWRASKHVRALAIIGEECQIFRGSLISLDNGSKRGDIILGNKCRILGARLSSQNRGKITIGNHVHLGGETWIQASNYIQIGSYSSCSTNVTICDNNNHPVNPLDRLVMRTSSYDSEYRTWKYSDSAPIIIGQNVWVGTNVRICKGVTIGDNSIVAACSVVTKDIPSNSIAAGNPAKVVKTDIHLNTKRYFND